MICNAVHNHFNGQCGSIWWEHGGVIVDGAYDEESAFMIDQGVVSIDGNGDLIATSKG